MKNGIMVSVVMRSVVMLNVVMLNVVVPFSTLKTLKYYNRQSTKYNFYNIFYEY
jgi:hypothetical protein